MPSKEDKAETALIESKKSNDYLVIASGHSGDGGCYQVEIAHCDNPAPGGSLRRCQLATNHDGIHRDGALAWFGNHWA